MGPKLASDLYLNSTGGKLLSNDSQVGVTGSMDIEKCLKLLRNLSEELSANFLRKFPFLGRNLPVSMMLSFLRIF